MDFPKHGSDYYFEVDNILNGVWVGFYVKPKDPKYQEIGGELIFNAGNYTTIYSTNISGTNPFGWRGSY